MTEELEEKEESSGESLEHILSLCVSPASFDNVPNPSQFSQSVSYLHGYVGHWLMKDQGVKGKK